MKAGLFICDHVAEKYQTEYGDYPSMFAKLLPALDWVIYDVYNNQFPDNLNECEVYVATGSAHSVYENLAWIDRLKSTIAQLYQQKKVFIGMCVGHQLIGEALGGKLEKSKNEWCVGVHNFNVINNQPWMSPEMDAVNLLMMCQDQITVLPPDAQVLASSERCPNGIIQVGNHFLGIQAHPEYAKGFDRVLMENREERIGRKLLDEGIESLSKPLHADILREWVMNFINK